jgi:hypothetical protein
VNTQWFTCQECGHHATTNGEMNEHEDKTGHVFGGWTSITVTVPNETPSFSATTDPFGSRSAERHDRVYGLPHANQRKWLNTLYERYESTMWGLGPSRHGDSPADPSSGPVGSPWI